MKITGLVGIRPKLCRPYCTKQINPTTSGSSGAASGPYIPLVRPHFDYKWIKANADKLHQNNINRESTIDVHKIVSLYDEYSGLTHKMSQLHQQKKEIAKERNAEKGKQLRIQIEETAAVVDKVEAELQSLVAQLPNTTHPDVPIKEQKVLELIGEKPVFDFKPKDHLTLGKELNLIDFESASVATGEKFYYLKNEAALLELALIHWTFGNVVARGWTPVLPPDMIRPEIAGGCGYQPKSASSQVYSIENHPLCMAGTAEIPLAAMYTNSIIPIAQLPIKMVAFGHAFRVEVGQRGAEARGLYRVHQFSKVEMFAFSTPEQSESIHNEMLAIEKDLFKQLGLHYRVLDMPANDLGAPAHRKFDIEAWMPFKNDFGEISSTSNCTDHQSRRLNTRYQIAQGNNRFVHTVNGTACAIPRMLICLLEYYQQKDGSIVIPEVLRPYMFGKTKIEPKRV